MMSCRSWCVFFSKKLIFSTSSVHFSHFILLQVDERAVLKHFDWPEHKADAMREAAFGYCDLKKLEYEASSFCDDVRQPSAPALKKMQALLEKYSASTPLVEYRGCLVLFFVFIFIFSFLT